MKKIFSIVVLFAIMTVLSACAGIPERNLGETGNSSVGTPDTPVLPSLPEQEGNGGETDVPPVEIPQTPSEKPQIPAVDPLEEKAVYVRSKTDGLNVRQSASTASAVLGQLDKGDMVAYLGEENGWYKTYFRNRTAYVSAKESYTDLYVMEKASDETEAVISVGLKLLGTPYVYGATRYHNGNGKKLDGFSVDAFDCSSLMQYMFYMGADINLNLTTRTQIAQGTKVSDLKRGDLMFFTNASRKDKTGIERVGHVALYLGDNYILHTASDHAVIEEISATRWSYFIQANRF